MRSNPQKYRIFWILTPRQETYLKQTHIHKSEATGNDAHRNAVAAWTEVKTLHKQQDSHIYIK
jgi:hypothetical protein